MNKLQPHVAWIALGWGSALFVLYAVSHLMAFILLITASPFIDTGGGMDLGPVAAVALWIALGVGALTGAATYLWLRSVGLRRRTKKILDRAIKPFYTVSTFDFAVVFAGHRINLIS